LRVREGRTEGCKGTNGKGVKADRISLKGRIGREYPPDWDPGSIGGRSGRPTGEGGVDGRRKGELRSLVPKDTVRSSPTATAGSLEGRVSQGTTRSPTTIDPGLGDRCGGAGSSTKGMRIVLFTNDRRLWSTGKERSVKGDGLVGKRTVRYVFEARAHRRQRGARRSSRIRATIGASTGVRNS
jgi:hypothetical protein